MYKSSLVDGTEIVQEASKVPHLQMLTWVRYGIYSRDDRHAQWIKDKKLPKSPGHNWKQATIMGLPFVQLLEGVRLSSPRMFLPIFSNFDSKWFKRLQFRIQTIATNFTNRFRC